MDGDSEMYQEGKELTFVSSNDFDGLKRTRAEVARKYPNTSKVSNKKR
jgi:hypothetical protein